MNSHLIIVWPNQAYPKLCITNIGQYLHITQNVAKQPKNKCYPTFVNNLVKSIESMMKEFGFEPVFLNMQKVIKLEEV